LRCYSVKARCSSPLVVSLHAAPPGWPNCTRYHPLSRARRPYGPASFQACYLGGLCSSDDTRHYYTAKPGSNLHEVKSFPELP
jgi:hypothetical protein